MIQQKKIRLKARPRGFHLITNEIIGQLTLPREGILNLFLQHSSAGITINENADPSVRVDFETIFNKLIPENDVDYTHIFEGADDMPAHIKSSLCGVCLSIFLFRITLWLWGLGKVFIFVNSEIMVGIEV